MGLIDPEAVIHAVEPWVGNCIFFDCLASTHAFALRLIDQFEEDETPLRPTLICAERQTAGVGRAGRSWDSGPGGLYFNLLGTLDKPDRAPAMAMLTAVAARRSLDAVGLENAEIKWPNDILIGGRKIAGVLIHARYGTRIHATVGVGVNLRHTPQLDPPPRRAATSLTAEIGAGDDTDRATTIVMTFVDHLVRGLSDPDPLIEDWRRHLVHREGEAIEVTAGNGTTLRGTYAGTTTGGHLRLATGDGIVTVATGDVT